MAAEKLAAAPRGTSLLIGAVFMLAGLMAIAVALGWFAASREDMGAPLWIIGCGGGFFTLTGLAFVLPDRYSQPRSLIAALLVSTLALALDWIAFAAGERAFGGAFSFAGLSGLAPAAENAGRAFFAMFAVLFSLLALWAWARWLRELRR